ncbi:hypothetical protein DFLDMN_001045 [Cupriavidus sp. H19C3]|uniref:hypothetical protein n=1 Tax=Cupriavidus sp. H19C3 TaxID=3241603 RepID=UPI003BF9155E
MTEQSIERTAIAICRVMYPEAWGAGQAWEQFPESTRKAMRDAAHAAWCELGAEVCAVVGDDGYAGTFRSMDHYRTALRLAFSTGAAC